MAKASKIAVLRPVFKTNSKVNLSELKPRLEQSAIKNANTKEEWEEQLEQETLAIWRDIELGKSKPVPHDKVMKWMRSWGTKDRKPRPE